MKKIIVTLLAGIMIIGLVGCGAKEEKKEVSANDTPVVEQTQETNPVQAESDKIADPEEFSSNYWNQKYPDENICPFSINVDGKEYDYFLISGLCDGTMRSWIQTPTNWDGWHLVDGNIVNRDETFKMTDDWGGENPTQSFSSCCTVTTEPYSA